jgi:Caspase domain
MNEHDQAVVVGIRRYADAGNSSGWIGDLNGPDNDADAVAAWLRKPDGGGLPQENVRVVRSAEEPDPFPPGGAAPHQRGIEDRFNELARLPTTAFEGQYAGRRLYLYVSGHGYARNADEAALVTAEAEKERPFNVLVTSWLEWFYTAARFKELVLWVDCCATRTPLTFLKPCDRNLEFSPNAASGRRFVAYAAGFDKRAVENQMPDGQWHGVFTYALLQGLEGAAAGEVTTDSLRDYLRNSMSTFMREDQRTSAVVAREPSFGPTDPMSFGTPAQRPKFTLTLRFPEACVGKRATVSVNASSPLAAETVLGKAEWPVELEAGSYVAFVPDANLFQAFSVTGEEKDAVIAIS